MISFKEFMLQEATEKHAVLALGRFNPPTTGHLKLIDKTHEIAKKVGGSPHIVVTHSHDPKKNPLTSEQKIKHLKRYAPHADVTSTSKESPSIFHKAAELHKSGVKHLHVVAGSDRVEEYKQKLNHYNKADGPFHFKSITVHSSGERDPDAEGDTGMSASKMRAHAEANNFKEFRKGVPSHVSDTHAKELLHDVRKGMGHLSEENTQGDDATDKLSKHRKKLTPGQ